MKFELKTAFEIEDFNVLDIVNNLQIRHGVEEFDELEEVPAELILMALEDDGEFQYQIDYLVSDDCVITIV